MDFIIHTDKGIVPIEVKFKKMKKPEVTRSFRGFLTKYKPLTGIIVNLTLDETLKANDTEVFFTPFWKLTEEEIPAR